MARHAAWCVTKGPIHVARGFAKKSSTKAKAFKGGLHTVMNWRTPTTRPSVPDPTDPEVLAQLHSTRWTSDLSGDGEAMRTRRLLRFQSFMWIPHLFLIPGMTALWVVFHPMGNWTYDALTFSSLWRFIWVLSLPNCFFAWLGFITPDVTPPQGSQENKPVHREYIRNFFIVLVTKGSNEAAVRRGYNKLIRLEKYHPAVKVVVLTDEPYVYPDLQNIVCPKSYKSPLGKAKYKARALDYFRYHVSLGVYDWILHMCVASLPLSRAACTSACARRPELTSSSSLSRNRDEESVTDAESLRNCIEFIRYTPHHFGQGIILYNGTGYWDNWYFTVADGIRVGDDLARFHLQNTIINRPVFGVHGSFLMTNGEMENECTWDFGSLAEDFEFSQDAWRRGFTCGRIHGIVREQSPTTLRDFLKQRRRWFMVRRSRRARPRREVIADGLPPPRRVSATSRACTASPTSPSTCGSSASSPSAPPSSTCRSASSSTRSRRSGSPSAPTSASSPSSCVPSLSRTCAELERVLTQLVHRAQTLYLWGIFFQELDFGQTWWKIPIHLLCGIIIQPFASLAEGLSAIWAMASEDFGASSLLWLIIVVVVVAVLVARSADSLPLFLASSPPARTPSGFCFRRQVRGHRQEIEEECGRRRSSPSSPSSSSLKPASSSPLPRLYLYIPLTRSHGQSAHDPLSLSLPLLPHSPSPSSSSCRVGELSPPVDFCLPLSLSPMPHNRRTTLSFLLCTLSFLPSPPFAPARRLRMQSSQSRERELQSGLPSMSARASNSARRLRAAARARS